MRSRCGSEKQKWRKTPCSKRTKNREDEKPKIKQKKNVDKRVKSKI